MNNLLKVLLMIAFFQGGNAYGFGSSTWAFNRHEHAFITTAALACDSRFQPEDIPKPCFETDTMTNLGNGHPGLGELFAPNIHINYKGVASEGFSAVEAPDNLFIHFSGGPDWWHCDKADYLNSGSYPQSRDKATSKLLDCRLWAQRMLGDGFKESSLWCGKLNALSFQTFRCEGAAAVAGQILDEQGNVSVEQPNTRSDFTGCDFNGAKGNIKCLILQQFGYGLHALQDYYSHSNYADFSSTDQISIKNPPGLGRIDTPGLWDLKIRNATSSVLPDDNLSVGCYPDDDCIVQGRTPHSLLNKDRSLIDSYYGSVTDIDAEKSPRGAVVIAGVSNSQRAINMAIRQTRSAWLDLQALIIKKEGVERGNKIICAIASDNPNKCGLTKSQAEKMFPQGRYDETRKKRSFSWVERDKAILRSRALNSTNESIISSAQKGLVVDTTKDITISCGARILDRHHITFDKQPMLNIHDLRVSGTSCISAVRLLRKTYLSQTSEGFKKKLVAPLQCILINNDEFYNNGLRLLCKNEDESIQVSFFPDCGNGHGNCRI